MSIKKSLLALAAMALALMGFASSATAATDGIVRDAVAGNTKPIVENTVLHAIGWAKFNAPGLGGLECHVTANIKATGATGSTAHVSTFTVPDTTKCTPSGFLAGCKLKKHEPTNLPWHVTATPTDFDITGAIVIHLAYEGAFCFVGEQTLTFSEITVKPLQTGTRVVTGTSNTLGGTAEAGLKTQHSKITGSDQGNPIAGFEFSGTATLDPNNVAITVSGELELTSPERCTYYLSTE